mmetsp:Transcript_29346/g.32604  ORF Transcript_29346/g.32604 Transcript_29346/m.32604 type:complete len:150 (-) Transcript_29346:281-730(-)
MNEVLPGLFLGSRSDANDKKALDKNKITHIVMICDTMPFPPFVDCFKYKVLTFWDNEKTNIREHFQECNIFISEAPENKGRVLVHCGAGASRAPTIVIAYVMNVEGYDIKQAIDHIRTVRPFVEPNDGFMKQLKTYEGEILRNPGTVDT